MVSFRPYGLLLAIALLPVACRSSDSGDSDDGPRQYIAFVGAGTTDPLWPVLRAGAERYAKTHPYHLIKYLVPDVVSPEEQAKLIHGLLGDVNLRGICVQVIDPKAMASVLGEASIHGVPVVTMIRDVTPSLRQAFCGIDEHNIGRQLAVAVGEAVEGSGNIMVLTSSVSDPVYQHRLAGFREGMDRQPNVHVLAYAECDGKRLQARHVLEEYTKRYPSVGAWVMLDNWAFSRRGNSLPKLINSRPIVAMNPFPLHWGRLESGECFALIGGDYGTIGYDALRLCEMSMGGALPGRMESLVAAEIVRASELVAFRVKWITWSSPTLDAIGEPARGSL